MTATLVFVHGRSQEFRDPAALMRTWMAGLNAGLTEAELPALGAGDAVLTFYGDVLYQITARLAQERPHLEVLPGEPDAPGTLHPEMPGDVDETERFLLADMAAACDVDVPRQPEAARPPGAAEPEALRLADRLLSWDVTRRVLIDLARRTRVDQEIITGHLRDVAVYLTRGRTEVLDTVRAAVPAAGPLVLVTHSLGTVVGRDLLDDPSIRDRTLAWITAGSPLGLEAVQRNMRPPGARHPGKAVSWTNAYDEGDVVALGAPLRRMYGDPLSDVKVENGDQPHAIERYLAHPEVARSIAEAFARG